MLSTTVGETSIITSNTLLKSVFLLKVFDLHLHLEVESLAWYIMKQESLVLHKYNNFARKVMKTMVKWPNQCQRRWTIGCKPFFISKMLRKSHTPYLLCVLWLLVEGMSLAMYYDHLNANMQTIKCGER